MGSRAPSEAHIKRSNTLVILMLFSQLLALATTASAHLVPGSIGHQLKARADSPGGEHVFESLADSEIDYINDHLKKLDTKGGCDQWKQSFKYAKKLLKDDPDHKHLVSLLLYKYCLEVNPKNTGKCDNKMFFIYTNAEKFERFDETEYSGLTQNTAIDFYDNDFLRMLSVFDTDNDWELTSFLFHKLGECEQPEIPKKEIDEYLSKLWPKKDDKYNREPEFKKKKKETFNVLDFTDTHIQLRYKMGTEANCSQSLCCMPESFNKDLPEWKGYKFSDLIDNWSGKSQKWEWSFFPEATYNEKDELEWGDFYDYAKHRGDDYVALPAFTFGGYKCDTPEILLNSSLKGMADLHHEKQFEFAISQGDYVDHDVYHVNPNATKYAELHSFDLFKHYLKNITVLPTLGNHDSWPYAQMAPLKYNHSNGYEYNIDEVAKWWINKGWFDKPYEEWLRTHYGGFVYETDRGLKVINLNSNTYYVSNMWNFIDQTSDFDPFGQWKWVVEELIKSEKKGQRVWLQAHVPPGGTDSLPNQQYIINAIVDRFSPYTIAATFFGHTHRDQIKMFYKPGADQTEENLTNMAWIAQSVTPFTTNNPGFKYFEIDAESFSVINSYNYLTYLNETFIHQTEPKWEVGYSARDAYDPKGEWPKDAPLNATFWHRFVVSKLETDIDVNQEYIKNQYRDSPFVPNCANDTKVSTKCHKENLCNMNALVEGYNKCIGK
ncbi:hypothetical protein DICA4_D19108 [Diutina catenulata]